MHIQILICCYKADSDFTACFHHFRFILFTFVPVHFLIVRIKTPVCVFQLHKPGTLCAAHFAEVIFSFCLLTCHDLRDRGKVSCFFFVCKVMMTAHLQPTPPPPTISVSVYYISFFRVLVACCPRNIG